ncbi:MAG: hypothetical protein Q4B73_02810 [Lachnospiraceae bacterium]|nr:hypothetical protein [Lachnospiraceae bacterium]
MNDYDASEERLDHKRMKASVILCLVAILIILVMALLIAFRLDTLDVTGNHHITDEELSDMTAKKPLCSNTLIFMLLNRHPRTDNPFVEDITAEYIDRNTVRLHVTEKDLIGYTAYNGAYWYFDERGVVQVQTTRPERGDTPVIEPAGVILESGAGEEVPLDAVPTEALNTVPGEAGGAIGEALNTVPEEAYPGADDGAEAPTENPGADDGAPAPTPAENPGEDDGAPTPTPAENPGEDDGATVPPSENDAAGADDGASTPDNNPGTADGAATPDAGNDPASDDAEDSAPTDPTAGLDDGVEVETEEVAPEIDPYENGTVEPWHIPLVKGLSVTHAAVGEVLAVSDPSIFRTLTVLTERINKHDIDPDYVQIEKDGTLTMVCGSITVLLGKDQHLEEKITELSGILPEAQGLSGVLHLESFDGTQNRIIFDRV